MLLILYAIYVTVTLCFGENALCKSARFEEVLGCKAKTKCNAKNRVGYWEFVPIWVNYFDKC